MIVTDRPLADRDAAARKLMELTHALEPVQDGQIFIEKVDEPLLVSAQRHASGIQGGS